ncbi:MAG: B12-binding domain-containing radical SAM protein [Candidatus Helarchaeota archaeon]|nr:B12-binding domain-containing radical SAM protein [Candidatus Helarchaeota archaeon]
MRVLLIMPNYGNSPHNTNFWFYGHIFPPLGLEYIAAHIEDLAEVRIIDNRLKSVNLKVVEKTIKRFRPDYVGISCNFSPQAYVACKIAGIAKEYGARTVVGGWHPTLVLDEMLDSPSVDIVVRGEGESTFRELVLKNSPVGVLGLSYNHNGKQIHNPDRKLLDLKHIRPPARHFRSASAKASYHFFGFPVECIEISRGCPYSCTFCCIHNFYRHRYRRRPIPEVIRELRGIANKASLVFIVDDNFVVDRKYVIALCDAIIKNGIRTFFKTQVRVDSIVNHPDVFKKMADAGFLYLFLGFESFSDRALKKLNKRIKFKEIKSAIKILHDLGYLIQGNVILGADLEDTKKDLETTIEIAKTLDIDMLSFTLLTVFPGTELMEYVLKEDLLLTMDWREFDWLAPTIKYPNLTSDELKYYLTKAHKEIPFFDNPLRRIGNSIRARGLKFFFSRIARMSQIKTIPQVLQYLMKTMRS